MSAGRLVTCGWFVLVLVAAPLVWGEESPRAELEYFENRVRPLLVEHCQVCHNAEKQQGGLRLDSGAALLKGGDSGPAVVPGDPAKSLLIEAVLYDPEGYQMPPTGKLSDEQIETLSEWVRRGAHWTPETEIAASAPGEDLWAKRLSHWSFQPVTVSPPPRLLAYRGQVWGNNVIDAWISSKLTLSRLEPALPATRATLIRRMTLELTGLPPQPAEVAEFVADESPDAVDRLVDRLLASPRYGERVGRHWLDLVRFAETGGHEFDFELPHTTLYRDYVVRALNADLPYDHFVKEHIAGDQLPEPRLDPITQQLESPIGTAFWWFGQCKHSPVDLRAEECETVDNQLDVFGKTFLGLTVACARCHDHKFDPIATSDYYALAGYLQSSRQATIDRSNPEQRARQSTEMQPLQDALGAGAAAVVTAKLQLVAEGWSPAALGMTLPPVGKRAADQNNPANGPPEKTPPPGILDVAVALQDPAAANSDHPLSVWLRLGSVSDEKEFTRLKKLLSDEVTLRLAQRDQQLAANVDLTPTGDPLANRWLAQGDAFGPRRTGIEGYWQSVEGKWNPLLLSPRQAQSSAVILKQTGVLRSPTFTIDRQFLDLTARRAGGLPNPPRPHKRGQIQLIVEGFHTIQDPLYGSLTIELPADGQWHTVRRDLTKFRGATAYLEVEDLDDGWIAVDRVELTDHAPLESPMLLVVQRILNDPGVRSRGGLARAYRQLWQQLASVVEASAIDPSTTNTLKTPRAPQPGRPGPTRAVPPKATAPIEPELILLLEWVQLQPWFNTLPVPPLSPGGRQACEQMQKLASAWPAPEWTIGLVDGTPEDEAVLIRGNPKKRGATVPRQFLTALTKVPAGDRTPAADRTAAANNTIAANSSGRLQLAERMVDPDGTLLSRVMVNRLWQHAFGRGLVPTPDDFGHMGEAPSHPELLDALASDFVRHRWSHKRIQRLLYTSEAYQQSTALGSAEVQLIDPQNRLWHRMSVQRLEGEAVRDALLALSGRLDERLGGASVLPYLTAFMEGRGRPGVSGPLDGDGRRSVYLNVRRNFLSPFFLAFDFPTPFTTMGRRTSSNVPAQALALMNNQLVIQQAAAWAERAKLATENDESRLDWLYQTAFARNPTPAERASAVEYLQASSADPTRAWSDLAHTLINTKEFLYVE